MTNPVTTKPWNHFHIKKKIDAHLFDMSKSVSEYATQNKRRHK